MSDDRLSKARILIQQKKYAGAEKILAGLLSENSDDAYLFILLAEAKLGQNKLKEADAVIENAIKISPDEPLSFYVKSRILIRQDNLKEAEKFIQESIRLNPEDADFFALLANIQLARKQFDDALETANQALAIDPENVLALTTRGSAFVKLGKTDESFDAIQLALREDPNNAYTHASYGWGLLENGERKKSLEHFKEALRKDPDMDYARSGMVEALKAVNPVYRLFLWYNFKLSKMTAQQKWGFIIGLVIFFQVFKIFAILGLVVVLFTWLVTPLSNMLLRFNKYGNLLLDKNEKMSSNFVAGSLCVFIVGCLLCFVNTKFAIVALWGFIMMFPFSVMFSPSKYRYFLWFYAFALASLGAALVVQIFLTGKASMAGPFIIPAVIFPWVANFLRIREDT
jgi:tetratricopeptide (TPR) repeat protein